MDDKAPTAGGKFVAIGLARAVLSRVIEQLGCPPEKVEQRASLEEVPLLSSYRVVIVDYDNMTARDRSRLERACVTARLT
ncbi:MAG: hypothetical protein ACT4TC_06105, partial [Myxococcaceae bacterium]